VMALDTTVRVERSGFTLSRIRLIGVALFVMFGLLLLTHAPMARAADDCTDSFSCLHLDVPFNNSQPFTASQAFDETTDISAFTLQQGERADCALTNGGISWGDKSAWYEFDSAVTGRLAVSVTVPGAGFNVIMLDYQASHPDPIDYTSTQDLRADQCTAHGTAVSFDTPLVVTTNGPTFVQVLAYCGDSGPSGPSPCPGGNAGGPVAVHFAFTADDNDGDGVPDTLDACPTVFGSARASGCPDQDNDGIPDSVDKCPTVAGPASANGCPDADGDGIPDFQDACPTVAGVASASGCPDADRDGIQDSVDKCPTIPGEASAQGCPDKDHDGIADSKDACPTQFAPATPDGCPSSHDSDHDGLINRLDKCPYLKGPKEAGGCPDRDLDGVPDKSDKCPKSYADTAIFFPGFKGRAGCPGAIDARLPFNFPPAQVVGHGLPGSVLNEWAVSPVPKGSTVTLTCAGKGCPRSWPLRVRVTHTSLPLLPLLRRTAAWRAGKTNALVRSELTLTVTVSHRGTLSRRETLDGNEHRILVCQSSKGRFTAACPQ
jgi:hypothetical protein